MGIEVNEILSYKRPDTHLITFKIRFSRELHNTYLINNSPLSADKVTSGVVSPVKPSSGCNLSPS